MVVANFDVIEHFIDPDHSATGVTDEVVVKTGGPLGCDISKRSDEVAVILFRIEVEQIVVQRCFQLLTSILRLAVTHDAACYDPKVIETHVPRVLEIAQIIAQTRRMREDKHD